LAILKAGGAYLPLDPGYPDERLAYMMTDSGAAILLTGETFKEIIPQGVESIIIDSPATYTGDGSDLQAVSQPGDLSYVTYTSGTTGKPKGVLTEHRNLLSYIDAFENQVDIHRGDIVLQQASYCFDAFVEEVFPTLLKGAAVAIPTREEKEDIALLADFISASRVTVVNCSPLLLNELNSVPTVETMRGVRVFISGGDVLKSSYIDQLRKIGEVYNSYGPTEATVCAAYHKCPLDVAASVPIGKPMHNCIIYILDRNEKFVPVGVPGELYIGGGGIARGYLNRPELTAEKFVSSPVTRHPSLFYKTGDLGRWLVNGNIEFLGRLDNQVKIRGYRIELEEIENCLLTHEEIKDAAVIARQDETGEKYLCAYIVPINEISSKKWVVSEFRRYLFDRLPAYMIPGYFVSLDSLPYTANGKIDRQGLPEVEGAVETGVAYVAPTNEIEARLVGMWADVLGVEQVGIGDNFFDLGGHSLSAMKLVSRVNQEFDTDIPLIDFFRTGTVKRVAEQLVQGNAVNCEAGKRYYKGLIRPFDLSQAPLMRVNLIKLQQHRHLFFIDMHHIVTDMASIEILTDEFLKLYSGERLPGLSLQYKDYAEWQARFIAGPEFKKQEKYWLSCFSDRGTAATLPLDFARPETRSHKGGNVILTVDPDLTWKVKEFSTRQGVTLFMLLLAVYNVVLSRCGAGEDIVVGTVAAGRNHPDLDPLIGMFVNTLALRNYPKSDLSFLEFLESVKENLLAAFENQNYPFEILVERLNLSGETHENPLFDTLFALENRQDEMNRWKEHELKPIPCDSGYRSVRFDLTLFALVSGGDIRLSAFYDVDLFKEETIRNLLEQLVNILSQVVADPVKKLSLLDSLFFKEVNLDKEEITVPPEPLIDTDPEEVGPGLSGTEVFPGEREYLLYKLNDTNEEYPSDYTVHRLFEEQVPRMPDRTAVISGDRQLTYAEVDRRAGQLAALLLNMGVGGENETLVGILCERSLEMMVGIMGILKAGAVYMPIEPGHPEERIRKMVKDGEVTVILTQSRLHSGVLDRLEGVQIIRLDDISFPDTPCEPVSVRLSSHRLAVALYTSGSTGVPKAVLIEHRGLVNRLAWMQGQFPLSVGDTILQKTNYTFDVSMTELFGWFPGGAKVCFLAIGAEGDPVAIMRTAAQNQITVMSYSPTAFYLFVNAVNRKNSASLVSVKWFLLAGEPLPLDLAKKFNDLHLPGRLVNLYGPTEGVIYATCYYCSPMPDVKRIPIGKPLGNTRAYVLDSNREPVPVGKTGELYLAGISLGRGYLNRPGLTFERYVPDPFFPGERMYRTGDLAVVLEDGNLLFLGRVDQQVKLKGIRIELGEIESSLLQHPCILEAAVKVRMDESGVNYLAAYLVVRQRITVKELHAFLIKKIPQYMIPNAFIRVDKMPLTSSGKLNRGALPDVPQNVPIGSEYDAPGNEIERGLVSIWQQVLKQERVGILDNFFELGGDSLLANLVAVRAEKVFNTSLSTRDIFDTPTIKALAMVISRSRGTARCSLPPAEKKRYYYTSSAQKRLYLLSRLNENAISYNVPSAIILEGELDEARFQAIFRQYIQRHEVLRTRFKLVDGDVVQEVLEDCNFEVELFEVQGTDYDVNKILSGEIPLQPIQKEQKHISMATIRLEKKKRREESLL
jgi:amino acid adenylation domain-containing protein